MNLIKWYGDTVRLITIRLSLKWYDIKFGSKTPISIVFCHRNCVFRKRIDNWESIWRPWNLEAMEAWDFKTFLFFKQKRPLFLEEIFKWITKPKRLICGSCSFFTQKPVHLIYFRLILCIIKKKPQKSSILKQVSFLLVDRIFKFDESLLKPQ